MSPLAQPRRNAFQFDRISRACGPPRCWPKWRAVPSGSCSSSVPCGVRRAASTRRVPLRGMRTERVRGSSGAEPRRTDIGTAIREWAGLTCRVTFRRFLRLWRNPCAWRRGLREERHALEPQPAAPASGCGRSRRTSSADSRRKPAARCVRRARAPSPTTLVCSSGAVRHRHSRCARASVSGSPSACAHREHEAEAVAALDRAERRHMEHLARAQSAAVRDRAARVQQVAVALAERVVHLAQRSRAARRRRGGRTRSSPD